MIQFSRLLVHVVQNQLLIMEELRHIVPHRKNTCKFVKPLEYTRKALQLYIHNRTHSMTREQMKVFYVSHGLPMPAKLIDAEPLSDTVKVNG